jgi:hypothetical protein
VPDRKAVNYKSNISKERDIDIKNSSVIIIEYTDYSKILISLVLLTSFC